MTPNETPHHPWGSSQLPKLARCVWHESKPAGPEAERGTRIHARIAESLGAGMVVLRAGDEDIAPVVQSALAIARRELAVLLAVEQLLELRDTAGRVLTFGTVDVFGRDPSGGLHLIDWKSGSERDHREQGACYALLVMDAEGENEAAVTLAYLDAGTTKTETFTRAEAEAIVLPILRRAEAKDEEPAINPYCGWCARRVSCPAWLSPSMTATAAVDADLAELFAGGLDKVAEDTEASAKFLTAWRAASALVEDAGIADAVRNTLAGGGFVPGWKLQLRKGRETIDAADFLRVVPKLGDVAPQFLTVQAGAFLKYWTKAHKGQPLPFQVTESAPLTALVPIHPGGE